MQDCFTLLNFENYYNTIINTVYKKIKKQKLIISAFWLGIDELCPLTAFHLKYLISTGGQLSVMRHHQ